MRRMIFITAVTLGLFATAQAAQVYKWVDAQGVTHFDAQPPLDQRTEQIDIQSQRSTPAPASAPLANRPQPSAEAQAEQRAIDSSVKKKVAQEEARRTEDCRVMRTNLSQLQNNPRVREEVEGGLRRLTEDDRKDRIVETQTAIEDYCL